MSEDDLDRLDNINDTESGDRQVETMMHLVDEELLELHGFGYQSNMRESFKKLIERHPILTK
jgi:hypothetical protein